MAEDPALSPPPPPAAVPPAPPDWRAGLAADLRDTPALKNVKDVPDLASQFVNMQALIGKKGVIPPADGATPDEWGKFYGSLGRPEKPDGYTLEPPKDTPEGVYQKASADAFKSWAHEAGLTPRQATLLHDKFVAATVADRQRQGVEAGNAAAATMTSLTQEWGSATAANVELAKKAVGWAGGDELRAVLERTGAGNDPHVIRAFSKIGQALGEDAKVDGIRPRMGTRTPDEARAEFRTLQGNPIYWDARHPEYKELQKKGADLQEMIAAGKQA